MKWKKDNKLPNTKSRTPFNDSGSAPFNGFPFDHATSLPLSSSSNDCMSVPSHSPMGNNMARNNVQSPVRGTFNGYNSRVGHDINNGGSYNLGVSQRALHFGGAGVDRMMDNSSGYLYPRQPVVPDYYASKGNGGAIAIPAKCEALEAENSTTVWHRGLSTLSSPPTAAWSERLATVGFPAHHTTAAYTFNALPYHLSKTYQ